MKSRHPRYIALNLEISAMEQKLYSIYDDLKKTHEFPSLEMIKHVFRNRTGIKKTLLSVFNDLIQNKEQRLGIEYAKGTIKNYISTKNRLKKFLKDVYMSTDIEISKLNEEFMSLFEIYLQKTCRLNAIYKHTQRFKAVIHYGQKKKWFTEDPFKYHQGKTEPTNRQYMTAFELQKIERLSFEGDLEEVRHMYLFMCYTGMSYGEVISFKQEHIMVGGNGRRFINKVRGKTDQNYSISLYEKAEELIALYKDHPGIMYPGTIFPYKTNKQMNDNIRVIASKAGITKALTTHVGRHTYATLSLESGVPMETLSETLGHKDLKTTQTYGKITKAKIEKDYQCATFLQ